MDELLTEFGYAAKGYVRNPGAPLLARDARFPSLQVWLSARRPPWRRARTRVDRLRGDRSDRAERGAPLVF